jgi:hypothetical protein
VTSAELHAMVDSLSAAMTADPSSAELRRAWQAARQAMLAASRREQGIPEPPSAADRITPIGIVADNLARKLGRVLNDDRLDRILGLLDENRDAVRERDRERIASALDSLARRASARAERMRRALPRAPKASLRRPGSCGWTRTASTPARCLSGSSASQLSLARPTRCPSGSGTSARTRRRS